MASTINASNSGFGGIVSTGDSSGQLQLQTANTTAVTIDTSQNVGIGTTSPNCRAHFQGGTNADGSLTFNNQLTSEAVYSTPPSVGTLASLKYNSSGSYAGMGGWSIGKENATDGNYASYLALHTRPNGGSTTERMRIDSSGNVGIGTTSPTSFSGYTVVDAYNGTTGAFFLVRNPTKTGQFVVDTNGVRLGSRTNDFLALTTNDTERMRIDSSGRVGINGTPASSYTGWTNLALTGNNFITADTNSIQIQANNYLDTGAANWIRSSAAAVSRITAASTIATYTAASSTAGSTITWTTGPYVANLGTSWTNGSDERLKNITSEITNAIDKVTQLRAAEFTWKHDDSNKPCVGLIAQDVQKVLPEAVNAGYKIEGDETEYLGVQYTDVIPLLVAAIKEQQTIINDLKARIETLESK